MGSSLRAQLHHKVLSRWYAPHKAPPWWSRALTPLTSWFIRRQPSFNPVPYRAPLIVVGNLTVGGSGKTPFVAALVKHLQQEGWRSGVICRGDGGRSTTAPRRVASSLHLVGIQDKADPDWGDEAQLHAMLGIPVWQGVKRHETAQALLAHHPEVNVLISDDGLQHRALHRDIEILMLNAERGVGNGWLLPAGPLREPMARLERVDAILLYRTHENAPQALADVPGLSSLPGSLPPSFVTTLQLGLPERVNAFSSPISTTFKQSFKEWRTWATASQHGMRIAALTGIAHPQSFFNALNAQGIQLAATAALPDHHRFTQKDLLAIGRTDAIFITEKDAVKCRGFDQFPLWVIPSHVTIPEGLALLLRQRLEGFVTPNTTPATPGSTNSNR